VWVSQAWLRVAGGLGVFVLIVLAGLGALGGLDFDEALETFTVVMVVAIPAGVVVYAVIEYAQTRRLDSITRQFDTRTLVLMPVAMALNIVLGTAVASALKIPIYLDSIGTILVAALAGPLAGAATGFLSNVVWTYLAPPPFGSPFAMPFAVVAVVVGLLAGTFARWGWLRPRPHASGRRLMTGGALSLGAVVVMVVLALRAWSAAAKGGDVTPASDETALIILGWVALLLVVGTAIGLLVLLVRRRDLAAAYILAAGVITGVVSAFIAAPIAAGLFGGVTGSGADFVIAAFRRAGADLLRAVLGQSLISDPVDKVITYFVAYLILGAMAARTKARFPQGMHLLPLTDAKDDDDVSPKP
jgi:energy-coupling factor transport system substrate-specific component